MPTLINSRGKRKSLNTKNASSKSPKHRRDRRDISSAASTEPRLDQLPIEVLQLIVLYGTNYALPQVCARLYYTLNAPNIHKRLLDAAFEWHWSGPGIWYSPRVPMDGQDELVEAARVSSWRQAMIRDALAEQDRRKDGDVDQHSLLLQQSWLTYELIRDGQYRNFNKLAQRELRRFLVREDASHVHDQLRELDLCLRSMLDWGPRSPYYKAECHRGSPNCRNSWPKPLFSQRREDGGTWCMYLFHERGLNSICLIQLETGGTSSKESELEWHICVYPRLSQRTELPARLLRGPWTQQKGYLLDLLICAITQDTGHGTDLLRQTYVDATDGLLDAIQARCLPAIFRLADKSSYPSGDFCAEACDNGAIVIHAPERAPCSCSARIIPVRRPDEADLPRSIFRLDATGEWRVLSEACGEDFPLQLTVVAEKRHLQAQLLRGSPNDLGARVVDFLFKSGGAPDNKSRVKNLLSFIREAKRMTKATDHARMSWLERLQEEYRDKLVY